MADTTTMTPEELLNNLKTRGFEESGFAETPLQEFISTLTNITPEVIAPKPGGKSFNPFTKVMYNFQDGDLEVLATKEAYPMPVCQIGISHSTKKNSAMYYFGTSVDRIINAGVPDDAPADQVKGQSFLIGKRLHMKQVPHTFSVKQKDSTYADEVKQTWELVEIMGMSRPTNIATSTQPKAASGITPTQQALTLLNGKTETAWYQEVFKDTLVKSQPALMNSIINKQFLPAFVASGAAILGADGKYTTHPELVRG
jgi:hypothetical protein